MKDKIKKYLPLLSLLAIPVLVFADDLGDAGPIEALMMHLMLSLHSAGFLCLPISLIFGTDKVSQKKVFWKAFWIRAIVMIILSFVAPGLSIGLDVVSIFVGGFIGFPLSAVISSKRGGNIKNMTNTTVVKKNNCTKCGALILPGNSFCTSCGQKFTTSEIAAAEQSSVLKLPSASEGKPLGASSIFGYNLTEEQMVDQIIQKEISKTGESTNISIAAIERRKNIFSIIYAIILFICVSLFFFHAYTGILIVVFLVVTIIYFNSVKKYNLLKYLHKEVKSRPDEKIGYIVSTVMTGKINNGGYKIFRVVITLVAIVVSLFLFRTPHTIYEYDSTLEGYVIRFYTIGWMENDEEIEIPSEYDNKPVVGIRGEVFANVKTIKKVVLPDTIKEIRGQAFQYASNLEEINIPDGITEIKGNTFEECNLKEVTIPDSVVRIGGHAFRSNSSLEKVNISANSQLKEIGSSAFRDCYRLDEIYLPQDVYVNERAFKGSGTSVKEYNADGIVLEDKYQHDRFVYIQVGESSKINEYISTAKLQGGEVKLNSVSGSRGNYSFNIVLTIDNRTYNVTLSRSNSYVEVTDDIVVEIDDDYVFEAYDDCVSLTIYYN